MKKIVFLMVMMISLIGYSQKNLIDSVQIYRVMPHGDFLETVYDFDLMGTRMDALSKVYKENQFLVKIYYKEHYDEFGVETEELHNRVYTSTWSRKEKNR